MTVVSSVEATVGGTVGAWEVSPEDVRVVETVGLRAEPSGVTVGEGEVVMREVGSEEARAEGWAGSVEVVTEEAMEGAMEEAMVEVAVGSTAVATAAGSAVRRAAVTVETMAAGSAEQRAEAPAEVGSVEGWEAGVGLVEGWAVVVVKAGRVEGSVARADLEGATEEAVEAREATGAVEMGEAKEAAVKGVVWEALSEVSSGVRSAGRGEEEDWEGETAEKREEDLAGAGLVGETAGRVVEGALGEARVAAADSGRS